MKNIIIVIMLLSALLASGQNRISAGEYWFDNDIQHKTSLPVAASQSLSITVDLPVTDLFDGLHSVHFRFRDDSSKWSSPISRFFVKKTLKSGASLIELTAFEYWFDNNISGSVVNDITNTSSFNLEQELDVTDLFNGLHTVHFRFKDTQGTWSSVISKFFIKSDQTQVAFKNGLTEMEYWFDSSLSSRKKVGLDNSGAFHLDDMVDVSTLFNGLHTIHYRFKDDKNVWSSAISRFFVKSANVGESEVNKVTGLEYWFDNDVTNAAVVALPEAESVNYLNSVDVSTLFNGLHTIHYRFVDARGHYSSAVSRFFVKPDKQDGSDDNEIVACRYWATDSVFHYINLQNSAKDIFFIDSLSMLSYPKGEYIVSMQFKDSEGKWSSAVSDTVQKLSYLFAQITIDKASGCDEDSLVFTAHIVDADTVTWDFDDGTKGAGRVIKHRFPETKNYQVSVDVTDTVKGVTKTFYSDAPVIINPLPQVDIGDSLLLINAETVTLDAGTGFASYLWNGTPGEAKFDVTGTDFEPGLHPFWVSVANSFGCVNSDTILIRVKSTLGVHSKVQELIKIYPNPATDYIYVDLNDLQFTRVNIKIIDLTGKVVKNMQLSNRPGRIDLHDLNPGNYLLVMDIGGHLETVQIAKQ